MSLVFLFFIVDKYIFCNSADPTLPNIGATVEDFNIAVSVMRLVFFIGAPYCWFALALRPNLHS